MSTTPVGLQCQIDNLACISNQLGLSVNTDKTKAMVFRRGGFLGKGERWFIDGKVLEVVNRYKYLGYVFTTKLSTTVALNHQTVRAKQKIVHLLKVMWNLRSLNTAVFFRLFDAQVLPALIYGSELWGLDSHDDVEKAHLFACKRFLNLDNRTPNCLVYGEMGRFPLLVNTTIKAVKYWLKLCKLPANRLPKQAYLMMSRTNLPGRMNWAKTVEECLCKMGFGYVWKNGGNINENGFVQSLKQRLRDCYRQEWHSRIGNSDRFIMYGSFKSVLEAERYLNNVNIKKFRDAFIRFRFGINELRANRRFQKEQDNENQCPFCTNVVENEEHFLLHCYLYDDIRSKYLKSYVHIAKRTGLAFLIDGRGTQKTRKVAMYIHYAMKRRNEQLSTLPPTSI